MKKIIITLLLTVTLMLGVTACSSKEEPKPATTTTPEVTKAEVTDAPVDVTEPTAEPTAEPTNVEPAVTNVVEPTDVEVTPEATPEITPEPTPFAWSVETLWGDIEPVQTDYEPIKCDLLLTPEIVAYGALLNKDVVSELNESNYNEYVTNLKSEFENMLKTYVGETYKESEGWRKQCLLEYALHTPSYMGGQCKKTVAWGAQINKNEEIYVSTDKTYNEIRKNAKTAQDGYVEMHTYSATVVTNANAYPDFQAILADAKTNISADVTLDYLFRNGYSTTGCVIIPNTTEFRNNNGNIDYNTIFDYIDIESLPVPEKANVKELVLYIFAYGINGQWADYTALMPINNKIFISE